jgi:hypothetical protein
MTDLHLDGNGTAGLLGDILGPGATEVVRRCQSCGDRQPLGAHRAYRGAGLVLRCPTCGDLAACIGVQEEHVTVRWFGSYRIAVDQGPEE